MVAFVVVCALLLVVASIVAKISGILALVVTGAWMIGFEQAHQYVAPLWWTFGISVALALACWGVVAYIAEK